MMLQKDASESAPHHAKAPPRTPDGRIPSARGRTSLILLLTLVIHAVFLLQIAKSPFFDHPVVDEQQYLEQAIAFAEGRTASGPVFWQAPLYPYFLGILVRIFGLKFFALHGIHVLLSIFTVLLLFRIGLRMGSRTVATWAAVLGSLYGTLLFFSGQLLSATLIVFLNLVVILTFLRGFEALRYRDALLAGLFSGFSLIAAGNIILFVPLAIAAVFVRHRQLPLKRRTAWSLCVILPALAVLAPVTARNYVRGKEFVLVSSNLGINLYLGNNPDYEKTRTARPGYGWEEIARMPTEAGARTASERSDYFVGQVLDFASNDPGGFFTLQGKKLASFWNGNEILRNRDIYSYRQYSGILSVLLFRRGLAVPFGIIAPLGLLGILIRLRAARRKDGISSGKDFILVAYLFTQMISVCLFFVTARYRLPAVPALLLYAAVTIEWIRLRIHRGPRALLAPALLLLFSLTVVSNRPNPDWKRLDLAEEHFHLSLVYYNEGMLQASLEEAEKALQVDARHYPAWNQLGVLQEADGQQARAEASYRRALDLQPEDRAARSNLAYLLVRSGRSNEAVPELKKLLRLMPGDPEVRNSLGVAQMDTGDFQSAVTQFREAVRLKKDRSDYYYNLGLAQMELAQYANAVGSFRSGLKLRPNETYLTLSLGQALYAVGQVQAAVDVLRSLANSNPDFLPVRLHLAEIARSQAHWDEAIYWLEQASVLSPDNAQVRKLLESAKQKKETWQK